MMLNIYQMLTAIHMWSLKKSLSKYHFPLFSWVIYPFTVELWKFFTCLVHGPYQIHDLHMSLAFLWATALMMSFVLDSLVF